MNYLRQLFDNLWYLSRVDIRSRERIIDEVRYFVSKPREITRLSRREAEVIAKALEKEK